MDSRFSRCIQFLFTLHSFNQRQGNPFLSPRHVRSTTTIIPTRTCIYIYTYIINKRLTKRKSTLDVRESLLLDVYNREKTWPGYVTALGRGEGGRVHFGELDTEVWPAQLCWPYTPNDLKRGLTTSSPIL